ncbi:MAG: CotH kinase family protein [Deltaproteobacteria bacterium]|nr:CotH kinase family protein [Deltaproteobacteria bacterium]
MADFMPIGTHTPDSSWATRADRWALHGVPAAVSDSKAAYHRQSDIYRTAVDGLSGYRVDLPNGLYRVTLQFIEPFAPEPGLRVFDVSAGDTVLVNDLDLAKVAGQHVIVSTSARVAVSGGKLELKFDAKSELPPVLAGLIIEPATDAPPDAPSGLTVRGGAGEALLRWDLPASAPRGWIVERSVNGGAYERVSRTPIVVPVFIDHHRKVGERIRYRVSELKASCAASVFAESDEVTIRDPGSYGLPVIDLQVDPKAFASIHIDPSQDTEVPVTVRSGSKSASGTIRLRGASSRWMPKRSFRIKLDSGKIDGRDRLKLLAEAGDSTRLSQLLAFDLYRRMGAVASSARAVLVRINGILYGVYNDIEHVGDAFLEKRGYQGNGDRFRAEYAAFDLRYDAGGKVDVTGFEKKENETDPSPELEKLLVWLNTAPEHELDAGLSSYLDQAVLVDYLAGQILFSNWEPADGGHYVVLDPDTGRFLLIPWDFNNGTWIQAAMPLTNNTLFHVGGANRLWTRAMGSRRFRSLLADRLQELIANEFGSATDAAVDATYNTISAAVEVEPFIWRHRLEDVVRAGPQDIHEFLSARRDFVTRSLPAFRRLGEASVTITRVASSSVTIENRSERAVDLASCILTGDLERMERAPLGGELPAGGARSVSFVRDSAGGMLLLICEIGDGASRSLVYYPPLSGDQAYLRSDGKWSVQSAL